MPMSKTIFFKLSDVKITPILLYVSEIWGLDYIYNIENVHLYHVKDLCQHPLGHLMQLSDLDILEDIQCKF
jgi:hypothetical protein